MVKRVKDWPRPHACRDTVEPEPRPTQTTFAERMEAKAWAFWHRHRFIAGLLVFVLVIACGAAVLMVPGMIINTFITATSEGEPCPFFTGSLMWGVVIASVAIIAYVIQDAVNLILASVWEKRSNR